MVYLVQSYLVTIDFTCGFIKAVVSEELITRVIIQQLRAATANELGILTRKVDFFVNLYCFNEFVHIEVVFFWLFLGCVIFLLNFLVIFHFRILTLALFPLLFDSVLLRLLSHQHIYCSIKTVIGLRVKRQGSLRTISLKSHVNKSLQRILKI